MRKGVALATLWLASATVAWAGEGADQTLAAFRPQLPPEMAALLRAADPAKGEAIFMRKCSACHDHKKEGGNGKGPHLWNLFGRTAATVPGFDYSAAMRKSSHTWDFATLDYYLIQPDRAVPGLLMIFRGLPKDAERADLLAFLRLLNDLPPPLP